MTPNPRLTKTLEELIILKRQVPQIFRSEFYTAGHYIHHDPLWKEGKYEITKSTKGVKAIGHEFKRWKRRFRIWTWWASVRLCFILGWRSSRRFRKLCRNANKGNHINGMRDLEWWLERRRAGDLGSWDEY